ncbi:uncharacterized protein SPSC_00096 [Sporisorium scitamineum]|uniref:Chalcone isomerase domain-containing protein n=1 Tax=Sporisorium scitamineum TaxID=49012 RepID=A0A127Z5F0_9BASI|nr:uncharacterized protein SPSC_00096 [Sporisorium scitamineum]
MTCIRKSLLLYSILLFFVLRHAETGPPTLRKAEKQPIQEPVQPPEEASDAPIDEERIAFHFQKAFLPHAEGMPYLSKDKQLDNVRHVLKAFLPFAAAKLNLPPQHLKAGSWADRIEHESIHQRVASPLTRFFPITHPNSQDLGAVYASAWNINQQGKVVPEDGLLFVHYQEGREFGAYMRASVGENLPGKELKAFWKRFTKNAKLSRIEVREIGKQAFYPPM